MRSYLGQISFPLAKKDRKVYYYGYMYFVKLAEQHDRAGVAEKEEMVFSSGKQPRFRWKQRIRFRV